MKVIYIVFALNDPLRAQTVLRQLNVTEVNNTELINGDIYIYIHKTVILTSNVITSVRFI